jgi:hypothetical protein
MIRRISLLLFIGLAWGQCSGGEVELWGECYSIENGGHTRFGSPYVAPSVVNASELLVDFFLEYNLLNLPGLDPNGDVNGDEEIDTLDFIYMLSSISSEDDIIIDTCLDLNSDSYIDVIDQVF